MSNPVIKVKRLHLCVAARYQNGYGDWYSSHYDASPFQTVPNGVAGAGSTSSGGGAASTGASPAAAAAAADHWGGPEAGGDMHTHPAFLHHSHPGLAALRDPLRDSLRDPLRDQLRDPFGMGPGQDIKPMLQSSMLGYGGICDNPGETSRKCAVQT